MTPPTTPVMERPALPPVPPGGRVARGRANITYGVPIPTDVGTDAADYVKLLRPNPALFRSPVTATEIEKSALSPMVQSTMEPPREAEDERIQIPSRYAEPTDDDKLQNFSRVLSQIQSADTMRVSEGFSRVLSQIQSADTMRVSEGFSRVLSQIQSADTMRVSEGFSRVLSQIQSADTMRVSEGFSRVLSQIQSADTMRMSEGFSRVLSQIQSADTMRMSEGFSRVLSQIQSADTMRMSEGFSRVLSQIQSADTMRMSEGFSRVLSQIQSADTMRMSEGSLGATRRIWQAGGEPELLSLLRGSGQIHVADSIQEYLDIRDLEPDEPPVAVESLRSLVAFIIQEPNILPPIVGSDPQGHMEIEWHLEDSGDPSSVWGRGNGVVSLRFLKSGEIQYVALSGPFKRGQERLKIHGISTRSDIIADLGEFAERVKTP